MEGIDFFWEILKCDVMELTWTAFLTVVMIVGFLMARWASDLERGRKASKMWALPRVL